MTCLLAFVDAVSADCFSEVTADVFMALGGVSESFVCYYFRIFGLAAGLVFVGQAHVLSVEVDFRLDQCSNVIRIFGQSCLYFSLNPFIFLRFLFLWF